MKTGDWDYITNMIHENFKIILNTGLEIHNLWFWFGMGCLAIIGLMAFSFIDSRRITKLEKQVKDLLEVNEDKDILHNQEAILNEEGE